ncbi:MAG: ferritin [Pirellulales bacterium]|nr:ferritin [Pirellulales bacterium]
MLNAKIQDAFNQQINAEMFSEYLYLSMAAHFESESLKGMANWMKIQAGEEHMHAMKFYGFILDRGGKVVLKQIDAPKTAWKSPLDAFQDVYQHEVKITGLVNGLANLAIEEKDHAAHQFLEWFVNEQVEEEAAAQLVVDQLKLVGDNGVAIYMIDQELGQRQPAAAAGAAAAAT